MSIAATVIPPYAAICIVLPLSGIFACQLVTFAQGIHKERPWNIFLVAVLAGLLLYLTAAMATTGGLYYVENYGTNLSLLQIPWAVKSLIAVTVTVVSLVQATYAYFLFFFWRTTVHRTVYLILPAVLLAGSILAQWILAVYTQHKLNQLKNLLSGRTIQIVIETGHLSMVIAAIVTANALLIMFAMAAFLFHSDRRITSNTTSTSARILQNLALMLTGGGLLVAICALAVLILRNVQSPLQSWDLIPLAASPFLYAITYLSLLNNRRSWSLQSDLTIATVRNGTATSSGRTAVVSGSQKTEPSAV